MRLNNAGFFPAADFVQFLFKKYSTSGLTFETDRDVAIHSLVERMGQVLGTEVRYGIFHCFLGSLLPWKRTHETKTPPIPYEGRIVPSWSWMAYSGGIDFITDAGPGLMVPGLVDLDFTNDGQALDVKVRQLSWNFRLRKRGEEYAILKGREKVGSLWFDVAGRIEFKHCVVVGMRAGQEKEDARKTYHVFIVRQKAGGGGYKRVGVGKVQAQYVCRDYDAGTLW